MRIMIDISEETYKMTCSGYPNKDGLVELFSAIESGTKLPKGHGDLIDRKALTKYPPIWMEDKRRTGEADAVILLSDILKAEAIIEADKGELE